MTKLTLYFLILFIILSEHASSQNANITIQINEKLITSPLFCSITFDSINGRNFNVSYVPGELLLDSIIWNKIGKDTSTPFWFHFYGINKYKTIPYSVKLTAKQLKASYLIIDVYDFTIEKYKRWYQWLTDKKYIVELTFAGSGKYLKHK